MAKKHSSSKTSNHFLKIPSFNFILILAVSLLLILFSFKKALFNGDQASFELPIYAWLICIALLFATTLIGSFYKPAIYKERAGITHLIVYLIPLSYGISMITAASSHYSTSAFLIHIGYAACFVISVIISSYVKGISGLVHAVFAFAYIIVIFGLANWFGDASFGGLFNWSEIPGGMSRIYTEAVLNDGYQARLASVFQYPNTYAALLMGVMLMTLLTIVHNRSRTALIVHSLFLIPVLVSFILTASRAAFIMAPILYLFVLMFLKPSRQITFILYTLVSCGTALVLSDFIYNKGILLQTSFSASISFVSWITVILCSSLIAAVFFLFNKYVQSKIEDSIVKWDKLRFANFHLPLTGLIIGGLAAALLLTTSVANLLPSNIKNRFESNQSSLLERGTFYQDAIELWKDHPIIGAGGGAWKTLYENYQSNPYTSREAHSFYLQTLVETGLLGILSFLLLIFVVLFHFIKSYLRNPGTDRLSELSIFTLVVALLLHSSIDFNMSFVIVGMIVYLGLGALLGAAKLPAFRMQARLNSSKLVYLYPSLLVGVAGVALVFSLLGYTSSKQYALANSNATSGKTLPEIMDPLDSAISKQKNPEYIDLKLQILLQLYSQSNRSEYKEEINELLELGFKLEPYYKPFSTRKYQSLMLEQKYDDAAAFIEGELMHRPWNLASYELLATAYYRSGLALIQSPAEALQRWQHGLDVESRLADKALQLGDLAETDSQGQAFGLTAGLALVIGQIHYYEGNYSQAEAYLYPILDLNFDDSKDFEAALFYLASAQKQGKVDQSLMDIMLSKSTDVNQIQTALADLYNQNPIN
ncbi:O-antigen ligase family protein [Cohnella boryungensis]|uniref:O-antigen ligase family protein n=1 Tax=Cohnella boryungensis TaxID=768479 RepID=A0ABV8S975_9BACL